MEQIKERVTDYWSRRVEQFSALRLRELEGQKRLLWQRELERYLPAGRSLDILDVGTGTGFFAFLLGAMGHHVTGIDLTQSMILEARQVAQQLQIPAEFFVMDAEKPDFPAHSFDAVVTRNLTWSLPHLPQAYASWHELLRPGGVLINFDADYCREERPAALPANHAHRDITSDLMRDYEEMKDLLRPTQLPRPQWDQELLAQVGFGGITLDTQVWQRIYRETDEFYNPTPIFTVAAIA